MSNAAERIPAAYSRVFGTARPVEFCAIVAEPGVYHVYSDAFEGSRCLRRDSAGRIELLTGHGLNSVTAARCRATVKSGLRAGAKALRERRAQLANWR